jgi:hypothetical protein
VSRVSKYLEGHRGIRAALLVTALAVASYVTLRAIYMNLFWAVETGPRLWEYEAMSAGFLSLSFLLNVAAARLARGLGPRSGFIIRLLLCLIATFVGLICLFLVLGGRPDLLTTTTGPSASVLKAGEFPP